MYSLSWVQKPNCIGRWTYSINHSNHPILMTSSWSWTIEENWICIINHDLKFRRLEFGLDFATWYTMPWPPKSTHGWVYTHHSKPHWLDEIHSKSLACWYLWLRMVCMHSCIPREPRNDSEDKIETLPIHQPISISSSIVHIPYNFHREDYSRGNAYLSHQ